MMNLLPSLARHLTGVVLACGMASAFVPAAPAQAQGQARPTRIVVPFAVGGASLLIVVSVVLETMQQIDSQLTMREYEA